MADLDHAADKYKFTVENAPEILALLGVRGQILYASPHTEKVLGYRAGELEGHNIFEFIHPEDTARAAREYSGTVERQGEGAPSFLRLRDTSGSWVPFEIIANNCLGDPHIQAIVFTARDLRFRKDIEGAIRVANADIETAVQKRTTELARINAELRIENQTRRHIETTLQKTVSLLNATLDSTADGILVVSTDGRVEGCNKKFLKMWQLSCESAVGKEDEKLLAEVQDKLKSPTEFLQKVKALYADAASTSSDVLLLKDGRIFERYSQPQRIGDRITGRVWSFRDVTAARDLETELRQSQKLEALGRLAGGVAHDFNNLIMLIFGYVDQLKRNPSVENTEAVCEQILDTTKRATSVTKQLLAFSRKQPDAPAIADLNLIVLNLERMLRRLLSDEIQLQVVTAADPELVYVDVSQIEMMIMNLVVNAQDAMPHGGCLSIATLSGPLPPDPLDVRSSSQMWVLLEVSDTGQGMSPQIQQRIFEPFFTTKQLGKGTGLGLSTVLGIAQRAGGRVDVQSEPGRGTTFRVYLPQVRGKVQPIPIGPSDLPPVGGNETILLAEDEAGIRTTTRAFLESLGYRVLEAADGQQAIERSLEYVGPVDLVLTDLSMPGVRGDVAVRTIQTQRPGISAIFMSGYADQHAPEISENMLQKPFEFQELGRLLRSVLDSRKKNKYQVNNPAA